MGQQQSENTLHQNAIGWFILLGVIAALCLLYWYYYAEETRNAIRWLRYGQTYLMQFVLPQDFTVTVNGVEANWHKGFKDIPKWKMEQLTYEHLSYFVALALQPLQYIFIGLCFIWAMWAQTKGPNTHNRENYSIESLINRQKVLFPVIAPFASFDPSKQPPRAPGSPVPAELPLFAEALGPEEWLAYYEIPAPDGKIDRRATMNCFKRQLIGRWKGPKKLKPHYQVLLAAFCLKASRKRSEADALLAEVAQCWTFKKGLKIDKKLLGKAQKILADKALSGKVLSACNRHAFVTTAMLRGLQTAREEGGVMASAEFVWLRAHDRTLWYPLNNLGRQSFHMEAMGAMSHFRAERITQRPIPVPKIEDAVDSIADYMASAKARPIPPLDYAYSKKRGVKKAT
ncbi:MAG: type IV secretion system protein [Pseudomonadota bacterium]